MTYLTMGPIDVVQIKAKNVVPVGMDVEKEKKLIDWKFVNLRKKTKKTNTFRPTGKKSFRQTLINMQIVVHVNDDRSMQFVCVWKNILSYYYLEFEYTHHQKRKEKKNIQLMN